MIVPHTRISSVPHTRKRVCGTRYHTKLEMSVWYLTHSSSVWETQREGKGLEWKKETQCVRAGVLGHVSDSMPLVIPFLTTRARELTPGPKPSCARTTLRWQLPGSNSRPLHWELAKQIPRWISQLQLHQRKQPSAGHVIATVRPGIPPYLLLLFLVQVCISVHGFRRPDTCLYVCRVSSWHPVCISASSVMSMVCV